MCQGFSSGNSLSLQGPLHVALLCPFPSCLCYKLAVSWPHGPGLSVLVLTSLYTLSLAQYTVLHEEMGLDQ